MSFGVAVPASRIHCKDYLPAKYTSCKKEEPTKQVLWTVSLLTVVVSLLVSFKNPPGVAVPLLVTTRHSEETGLEPLLQLRQGFIADSPRGKHRGNSQGNHLKPCRMWWLDGDSSFLGLCLMLCLQNYDKTDGWRCPWWLLPTPRMPCVDRKWWSWTGGVINWRPTLAEPSLTIISQLTSW